jgi:CheY-like chemotaxis protein
MIRLLLADDSMLMRDIIKDSLIQAFPGISIHEAATGKEAQTKLQNEHFDAVLCDWEMPELSGLELLKWVRSTPSLATLPFIMVTGTTAKESVVECITEKVTGYIVKPFTPEVLCQKIGAILKLK